MSAIASPVYAPTTSKLWIGRVLSGLVVAFLAFDTVMKFALPPEALEAVAHLGWQLDALVPLGYVLGLCTILYAIPRTAVLGAILLTGYLGGAVATHARVGDPLPSHTLFPIYIGIIAWLGLYLRDARVRGLFNR